MVARLLLHVHLGGGTNKNVLKSLRLIWLSTIWVLWKGRNDKIFNCVKHEVDGLVEEIKVLSWRWMLHRMSIPVCLFYEWCWNTQLCLRRVRVRLGGRGIICVASSWLLFRWFVVRPLCWVWSCQ